MGRLGEKGGGASGERGGVATSMACPAPCRGRVGHCRVGVGHCRRARVRAAGCVAVCPPFWEPALRGARTRAAARRGGRCRQPAQGRLPCLLRPPDAHLGSAGRRSARGCHRQRRPRRPPALLPDRLAHLAGRSAGRTPACMSQGCYLMDAASGAGGGAEGPPSVRRTRPTPPNGSTRPSPFLFPICCGDASRPAVPHPRGDPTGHRDAVVADDVYANPSLFAVGTRCWRGLTAAERGRP